MKNIGQDIQIRRLQDSVLIWILHVVIATLDVFQKQLYLFTLESLMTKMTTVGYIVQEDFSAGGPSQKGVWKFPDIW